MWKRVELITALLYGVCSWGAVSEFMTKGLLNYEADFELSFSLCSWLAALSYDQCWIEKIHPDMMLPNLCTDQYSVLSLQGEQRWCVCARENESQRHMSTSVVGELENEEYTWLKAKQKHEERETMGEKRERQREITVIAPDVSISFALSHQSGSARSC